MELCDELKAAGLDVKIAIPRPSELDCYPSRNAVSVIPIDSIFSSRLGYDSFSPDIVHVHGLWSFVLHQVVRWAIRQKVPIIWSPHGMLAPWAMAHKRWKKFIPWIVYQKSDLKKTVCFHATVNLEAEWIKKLGFKQPCEVIPLGVALPTKQDKKSFQKDKGDVRIILFVGRMYPVKNLDTLIKAFQKVKSSQQAPMFSGQNWKLVLVGPDQAGHLSELMALAKSMGLNVWNNHTGSSSSPVLSLNAEILGADADVFFTGALFDSAKDSIHQIADFFVLPSHTENFAGVLIDALAYEIPCVVSKKTPWQEVEEEQCGFWVENDVDGITVALLRMMSLSDEERQRMGMNGYNLVSRKYTWKSIGLKMLDVYTRMKKVQRERA